MVWIYVAPLHVRMKAAIAALPYEHPKLAVTAVLNGDNDWAARMGWSNVRH